MNTTRTLLLALSVIGSALFGLMFATSIANPGYVEQVAKDLIRYQVEKKVHEKVESIDAKFLSSKAAVLVKRYGDEVAHVKRQLNEGLPEKIATVIAEMQNLDCECRKKIEKSIRSGFEWQIASAAQAQEQLTSLIRSQYMDTAESSSANSVSLPGATPWSLPSSGSPSWSNGGPACTYCHQPPC